MNVGVRELKAQLSKYLGFAAEGQSIVVTDRGKPIATLGPLPTTSLVEIGVEEGWIDPPNRSSLSEPVLYQANKSIASVLTEDRG